MPATNELLRPYFGIHRLEWKSDQSVNFNLGYGDWIRLLHKSGFEVEDLIELQPAVGSTSGNKYVPYEWARNWPSEEVWKARKRG